MPIPHYSLHARLFSIARGNGWPVHKSKSVPSKSVLLRFANVDASVYCVIEGLCDRCEEAGLQVPLVPVHRPYAKEGQ